MKNILLLTIIVAACSFTAPKKSELFRFKNDGKFTAVIDGKDFDARDNNKYTATVNDNTVNLTFYGNTTMDRNRFYHGQNINIEYTLDASKPLTNKDLKIVFDFNGHRFYNLPELTEMTITKMEWNAEQTGFTLSADYFCRIEKPRSSDMFEGIIKIHGSIENIFVSVPSAEKQVADNE